MKSLVLHFEVHGFWHAGTGRGTGADLDAVVARTASGLPYLPGRTVRGLLRDACELGCDLGAIPPGWTHLAFGTALVAGAASTSDSRQRVLERARYETEAGFLRFGSACVGATSAQQAVWEAWARDNRARLAPLFRSFASTRIDADGTADDRTLRAVELAVPMALRSTVTGPDGAEWGAHLQTAAGLIRGIGSHRNRGLGRCKVTVEAA